MFHFEILLHNAVGGIRDIVHNDVQVNLVWFVAVCIKRLPHFDAVWMVKHLQDLQFSVLVAFVLEDFLDGDCFTGFSDNGFEHDTERTISNNFLSVVSKTLLH